MSTKKRKGEIVIRRGSNGYNEHNFQYSELQNAIFTLDNISKSDLSEFGDIDKSMILGYLIELELKVHEMIKFLKDNKVWYNGFLPENIESDNK